MHSRVQEMCRESWGKSRRRRGRRGRGVASGSSFL